MRRVATFEESGTAREPLVNYAVAASESAFRAVTVACPPVEAGDAICLSPSAQQALGVAPGENVTCVRI
jgi:arginine N-succinyltransferase